MIDWGSRPISVSGNLESIVSASQKGTLNSEGEKLNETEENTLLLKQHLYLARRGVLGGGGPIQGALACSGIVYLADSDIGRTRVRIDFLPVSRSVICCHW